MNVDTGKTEIISNLHSPKKMKKGDTFVHQRTLYRVIDGRKRRDDEYKFIVSPRYKMIVDYVDLLLSSLSPKEKIWSQEVNRIIRVKNKIYESKQRAGN